MRNKWFKIAAASALILLPFVLHQAWVEWTSFPDRIVIGGGPSGGLYHPLSQRLGRFIESRLGIEVEVVESLGTLDNLHRVQSGKADLAMYQPGALEITQQFDPEFATRTGLDFDAEPLSQAAFIANLYSQPLHFVTRRGTGIETMADLKGKTVNIGLPESGDYPMALLLLDQYELAGSVTKTNLNYNALPGALATGTIDAAFITVGMQSAVFQELATGGNARFSSLENRAALAQKVLYLSEFNIPRGIYRVKEVALPETDIETVSVGAHLIARKALDPDLVEEITRIVLDRNFIRESRLDELYQGGATYAKRQPFFPMHLGARWGFFPEEKTLLNPDFVEMWENLRSFLVSMVVALFLGLSWLRKRRDQKQEHKLDHYIHQVLEIERLQIPLDLGTREEDLIKLNDLLDRVTHLRQDCLKDFTVHQLQEDRGIDCFLEMCHSLSEKINAKLTRMELGIQMAHLSKRTEKKPPD